MKDTASPTRIAGQKLNPAPETSLLPVFGAAALWVLSDSGFYYLLPTLGIDPDYNKQGIAIAMFYTFWIGVAAIAFWPQYAS